MSETASKDRLYWSTAEAAHHIGFSEQTLWEWAKNATSPKPKKKARKYPIPSPPCIRFGKFFRFPIAEFKAWAQNPASFELTTPKKVDP